MSAYWSQWDNSEISSMCGIEEDIFDIDEDYYESDEEDDDEYIERGEECPYCRGSNCSYCVE